jgi:anaerobic selenocysteine-containing dehydrogenase
VSLNQPAIEPLGEAIPNTELFRRLGRAMGYTEEYFTRGDEDMIANAFDWSAPAMEGITVESLKETGWARLNLPDADTYAPHAEGNFPTPSGKTEFVASIAAGGNFVLPLFRQGSNDHQPGQPVDPLPHYIPPREAAWRAGRGLNLISPKAHSYLNSSYGDQPAQQRIAGDPAVILHPKDAADRGINDGAQVRVFNERGSFVVVAKISDEIAPGVACAYMGGWRKMSTALATVNSVNPFEFADLGNAPTFSDTLVEVEPV